MVNTSGAAIPVTISEDPTTLPGVQLDSIGYQGNGIVKYDSTYGGTDPAPGQPQSRPVRSASDPGAGINVVTFTNGSVGASGDRRIVTSNIP